MKRLVRNLLVVAVAVLGSMPVQAGASAKQRPCVGHGGVESATAGPGAGVIEIRVYCNDGQSEGPYVYEIR